MKPIPLNRVNNRNTNIRQFSDPLWRELRKCRYKDAYLELPLSVIKASHFKGVKDEYVKVNGRELRSNNARWSRGPLKVSPMAKYTPNLYDNEVGDIGFLEGYAPDLAIPIEMSIDIHKICSRYLQELDYSVAVDWFNGLSQQESANRLGISQATVCYRRINVSDVMKKHYFCKEPY